MSNTKTNRALIFIFITLLLDCTGIGIIIPVVPTLIQELTGEGLSEASVYGGWLGASYAIMLFIFAPVLGGLSDRFGRRPVLLLSLFGLGIDYIFLALAPTISWLFIGRIIAGICGASFSTASAYIADISTPDKRAQNFGMLGAAFGLGFIIGPLLGAVFSNLGVKAPFIAAAVLTLINFIYGYFVLPESLAKENRRKFDIKRANPLGTLVNLKRYPLIIGLVAAITVLYLAGQAAPSVWTFYTMKKFAWDEAWVGYSLAFVGLTVAIVQGVLIRILVPALGQHRAIFIGLLLNIVGFLFFAFATDGWMMFAAMIPYALGGIAGPSMQSIMSGHVSSSEQGELQGVLTSLMSVTSIIGPLLMTGLFAYFTSHDAVFYFPGAPFLMGGILAFFGIFLAMLSLKRLERIKSAELVEEKV